jgi:DNA-binding MarR family transcriptional regulator
VRSDRPCGIFGHGTREAVLAAIHVLGPATTADVARVVGTDSDHATSAVRHFERYGLVRVNRNGANRCYATIDWRSPVYDEARALAARFADLLGMRGEPQVAHRWGVGRIRTEVPDYVGLFGSPTATRVLLHVAATQETDITAIVAALSLEDSLAREMVARLERDGLVRRRRDGRRRPVSLDPTHPAGAAVANLLAAILRVNSEHIVLASAAAHARRAAAAIPHRDKSRRAPENAAAAMLGFIDPRYARALVALVGGALTGPDLARRLGLSRGAGRPLGRALARARVVREIRVVGPHVVETAFLLDPAHPAAAELRAMLLAASRRCGVPANTSRRTRKRAMAGPSPSAPGPTWPPDRHGRLALLLAMHGGANTVDDLSAATGWPRHVARPRVLGMVAAKLAAVSFSGTVLVFTRDPAHPLAAEIDALLATMSAAGLRPSDLRTMYGR